MLSKDKARCQYHEEAKPLPDPIHNQRSQRQKLVQQQRKLVHQQQELVQQWSSQLKLVQQWSGRDTLCNERYQHWAGVACGVTGRELSDGFPPSAPALQ